MSKTSEPTDSFQEYQIESHPNTDYITTTHGISRVLTSQTHVQLGDLTFHRDDFMRAFEGYLNPGFTSAPTHKFGNPVPFGVLSFSVSLLVLSLVNCQARGVTNANGTVGLCFFYAGFIELCAGMWCIVLENTWAATLLTSFAGFWFSKGIFLIDAWGIMSSFETPDELHNFLGFFVMGFSVLAVVMWMLTFKSTWVLFTMMCFVVLTFITTAASELAFTSSQTAFINLTKASGYFGIITACFGFYIAYEGMATKENALFVPPVLLMPSTVTGLKRRAVDEKSD